MSDDINEKWRQAAAKRRKALLAARPKIRREFGGLPCVAQRIDLAPWIRGGRVPDFFLGSVLGEQAEGAAPEQRTLTAAETRAGLIFQRDVVCGSLAEPEIIVGGLVRTGQMLYADFVELFPDAVKEICEWQLAGAPGIPVEMADGTEASIADINFSSQPAGSAKGTRKARTGKRRTSQRKARNSKRDGRVGV